MKGGIFSSIFFLVFVALLVIFFPAVFLLKQEKDKIFISERRVIEGQMAQSVLNQLRPQGASNPLLMADRLKETVQFANVRQKEFQFLNAGIYQMVRHLEPGHRYTFNLAGQFTENILDRPPESYTLTKEELVGGVRMGELVSTYWILIPNLESPDFMLAVTLKDIRQKNLLGARGAGFWATSCAAFFLLYFGFGLAIYWIIKKPVLRLQAALQTEQGSIEQLQPEEFGDLGDLVQALKTYVDRTRSFVATAENVDPVTGLMSGQTALSAYLDTHRVLDEIYVFFFRANFAKEYVKTFGRAFRDKILKITGMAVASGIPSGVRLYAVQDHFLMTFMTDTVFQQSYPLIQKYFNKAIRPLYEKGENTQAAMMTISAVGISNKSGGYETFHDTLQKLHDDWDNLVNRQMGGWAIMDSDDQWVKGLPEEGAAAETEVVPEEPESLKDPVFARKVFIVKLAFMFQFDPQKASKLYKLGYTRLPALLEDGVADAVKKYGLEADVRQLADKMRIIPKKRLYYNESDFKQVFITDVRMIRKIPREIVGHWFAAGLRRLEDLADMAADDMLKIDGSAGREDVEAVIAQAKSLQAAGPDGGKS